VDFAHLVNSARIKENALGRRGFTSVDMGGYADVSRPLEREWTILGVDRRNFGLVGDDSNGRCSRGGHEQKIGI
jgi:hypothetical protein